MTRPRPVRESELAPAQRADVPAASSWFRAGDAEVGDQRVPVLVEQDVLGLDVAVHDAVRMRVVQRVGDLAYDPERVATGRCPSRRSRARSDSPLTYGIT